MKNIATMIVSILLGGIMIMLIMALLGRMNRSMELKSNLPSVAEETLANMTMNPNYTIDNYHEFVAELIGNLAEKMDSDSQVTVRVLGVDTEKGILSLKVIEEFVHPNGKMGSVECERTVILNKLADRQPEYYQVKFYLNKEDVTSGKPYKVFRVLSGSTVKISTEPKATDGTFVGWFDTNDYMADFSIPVEKNLIYYAAWN